MRFVHPTHNFAIIQYDPAVFRDAPEASKPTAALLDARELAVGDEFRFVGLCRTNPDQSLSQPVVVTEISCVNIAGAHVPRFRALNEEIAKFDQVLNKSLGGVLLDEATGAVVATWSCYSFYSWNDEKNYEAFHAVSVDVLRDALAKVAPWARRGCPGDAPVLRSVGFGLKRLPLSTARTSMKLDEAWVRKLQEAHPQRSQVLSVAQLSHEEDFDDAADAAADAADAPAGGDASDASAPGGRCRGKVLEGDLLLAVDGEATATFRDVENKTKDAARVTMTLWRESSAVDVDVPTYAVKVGPGTERVLVWCGLLLQAPHRAVTEMGAPKTGVYCSYYLYGSPAHFYSIKACRFVLQVNDAKVETLDDFVEATKGIADGAVVKLKTSDLQGQVVATTLKSDYHFSPSHEFVYRDGDWTCQPF